MSDYPEQDFIKYETSGKAEIKKESDSVKNSIYIIGGEKGGVGKSLFSRIMLEYFLKKDWRDKFTLIDADPTIDDVSSVFPNCEKILFSDSKYLQDQPAEIFKKAREKTVVVNLPSNVARQFDTWMLTSGVLEKEAKQNYGKIYYFFISDGCFRSANHFIKQVAKYNNQLPHILVLNPGRLTCSGTFHYLENYEPLMTAIRDYNVPVLMCPELSTDLQFFCDEYKVTYTDAAEMTEFFLDKQRLTIFLRKVTDFFDKLFLKPNQKKPADINELANLNNFIKEQEPRRQNKKLPIPSKEELLGMDMAS